MTDWIEIRLDVMEKPKLDVLEIIYDALMYGFEFKVENHTIYMRELEE